MGHVADMPVQDLRPPIQMQPLPRRTHVLPHAQETGLLMAQITEMSVQHLPYIQMEPLPQSSPQLLCFT